MFLTRLQEDEEEEDAKYVFLEKNFTEEMFLGKNLLVVRCVKVLFTSLKLSGLSVKVGCSSRLWLRASIVGHHHHHPQPALRDEVSRLDKHTPHTYVVEEGKEEEDRVWTSWRSTRSAACTSSTRASAHTEVPLYCTT